MLACRKYDAIRQSPAREGTLACHTSDDNGHTLMTDPQNLEQPPAFGTLDATYQAAGGEDGIRRLVDSFYAIMGTNPAYARIYHWHANVPEARDKLARFLCGWMGGPKRYREKYGPINIPQVHGHLPVTSVERDMWLDCMSEALAQQPYSDALREYLRVQLAVPAQRITDRCDAQRASRSKADSPRAY